MKIQSSSAYSHADGKVKFYHFNLKGKHKMATHSLSGVMQISRSRKHHLHPFKAVNANSS